MQSRRKDTLVVFRVATKDIEFLNKCAEDDYKSGEIKAPTLAAFAKHLLYQHLNILKDIEKARAWRAEQPRNLDNSTTEVVEEENLETASLNYYCNDDYDDQGVSLKRPYFYELYPDWKERIARIRPEHSRV